MPFSLRMVLGLMAFVVWVVPVRADAVEDTTTFPSGGKDIHVERFVPKGKGPFPTVLMFNGSLGVEAHGQLYRDYCRRLVAEGYLAILVHYFDRTGTKEADVKTAKENFMFWLRTVSDAIDYAESLPVVDRKRIGLVGFSLGAYLSLSVAAIKGKEHIAAVADYAGALVDLPVNNLKKMPPTLILHGEKDDIVPVKNARDLEALLKQNDVPYEIKLYENEKHLFSEEAARDGAERVLKFFAKYLKGADR